MTDAPFRVTLPVNTPEIERLLPHRYPFLLVDRVVEFEKDKRVLAYKNVTCNEPFFTGHFPGHPVMPGVLVVDDSLSVRNALQQLVHDAGFRVETARDGLDAIERLKTFKPQLLLTDLEMPNMNGVELTAYVRARADLHGLPIIMITSRSQDKHRQLADQAGVDQYITKPYRDLQLLETIRAILAPKENLAADA